jgi:hypothetical protein
MSDARQLIPVGGLLATMAMAGYMVAQLHAQTTAVTADFTNATVAEVRDSQGQVLLRGSFVTADEDDNDVERHATLEPTGIDADARGQAEVEFAKTSPSSQEVEFSVSQLQPGATVTFVIDGTDVATAVIDRQGEAEIELDVRIR